MIYDNCIKYIDKELKRNLIDKEWKQKNFLIYGLDSLGKTVYMLLKEYKVSKLEYYDSSIYNKEWAQNEYSICSIRAGNKSRKNGCR